MTGSELKIKKNSKRLKVMEAFKKSGIRPHWMVMEVLPVLPPDLRPLVPLDGGRFATSDLNDLYRRVINRNNRLARLLELKAPEIIRAQRKAHAARGGGFAAGQRPSRQGDDGCQQARAEVAGRHDQGQERPLPARTCWASASTTRAVRSSWSGPTLKLHQCGLPKLMAIELFKPFIFSRLEAMGIATYDQGREEGSRERHAGGVDILEEVIKEHPVLLNRAPTLHRLGIQAFEPVLIEGKAIQLHPLVCSAFNADFDGDQMAVHIPLSIEAQMEARTLMLASNNVLFPANGEPSIVPSQDVVLGLYYATRERINGKGEGMVFMDLLELQRALDTGAVEVTAKISVMLTEWGQGRRQRRVRGQHAVGGYDGRPCAAVGNPAQGPAVQQHQQALKKKEISRLINVSFRRCGLKETVVFADKLLQAGFKLATRAGISIAIDDMLVPKEKPGLIERAEKEVKEIEQQYVSGLVTAASATTRWSTSGARPATKSARS